MFLVPGGRFLIIDDDAGLQVMDIGVPGSRARINPPRIALKVDHGLAEDLDDPRGRSMTVQENGTDVLRIAIVLIRPTMIDLRVYDVFLVETNTYSTEVGRLSLTLEAIDYYYLENDIHLDQDRLLVQLDDMRIILIWDFVKCAYALNTLSIERTSVYQNSKAILVNGVALVFSPEGMLLWHVKSWNALPPDDQIPFAQLSTSHEDFALTSLPITTDEAHAYVKTWLIPSNWDLKCDTTSILVDMVTQSTTFMKLEVTAFRLRLELALDFPSSSSSVSPDARVKSTLLCQFSFPEGTCHAGSTTHSRNFQLVPGNAVFSDPRFFVYSLLEPPSLALDSWSRCHGQLVHTFQSTMVPTELRFDHASIPSLCTSSGKIASISQRRPTYGYIFVDEYLSYHPFTSHPV
ncbi:hypothetical protein MD484_g5994, partial [Candolleomyces efflorescens]